MENVRKILKDNLNTDFLSAVLSNPVKKEGIKKIKVRPLLNKNQLFFQCEIFRGNQVFHENYGKDDVSEALCGYAGQFKQIQMETKNRQYTILISKKGKATVKTKEQKLNKQPDLSHNREKQYILKEGVPVPFLEDLGVMTKEGIVVKNRFDKFRQINRFLEFIEDILPRLDRDREITVLDFGCGKSYLTFAVYYYMHIQKGYDVRIIGLDLKEDVIRHCNELKDKYGYEKLTFLTGDIVDYTGREEVDMVITLHACDTATDYALAKAVGWNAEVISSVPCCQHELNAQIRNETLAPVLKYGLIKERLSALVTDALRAGYLEEAGYDTQILEFIDMEHTPKNILIRAVKTSKKGRKQGTLKACEDFLHVSPTLGKLLNDKGE